MRRTIAAIAVVAGGLLISAGCASEADTGSADTESADAGNDVGEGLGSQDASADVSVVAFNGPDALGMYTPKLSVTNNSSKTSDYYVEANIEKPNGTVITFTNALVSNLQPGATAQVDMVPVSAEQGDKVVITEVQRTASA